MNENITALIQKVTESEELQAKFAALTSPEEAFELAKTIQDGFTKEEFLEAAKAFSSLADGDISDEDLATASGGVDNPDRDLVEIPKITDRSVNPMTQISRTTRITKSDSGKASKALAV